MNARSLSAWLWFRGRYYLSALVLVLPVMAFPAYLKRAGTPPLGANIRPEREIGPYRVTLAEMRPGPPRVGLRGHIFKDYAVRVREGYPDRIRTISIRVGPPPNRRTLGEIMHGSPYRLHAHVRFMTPPAADDQIWISIEDWNGTLHQASWPLPEVMTRAGFDTPKGK